MGWLLDQFGLGNGLASEIAGIRDQLRQIESRLGEILAATKQLQADLAQGTYSGLVAQTTPIIARVDKAMADLDAVARMAADDPDKAALSRETLNFIGNKLMGGEQEELAKRIQGEIGADGLIVAASKTVRARTTCCWTRLTSQRVREVLDYYQSAEARLLLLRVEYMHAHPHRFPGSTVKREIEKVETELRAQDALLKPSPAASTMADVRTNFEWNWQYIHGQYTADEARKLATDTQKCCGWRLASSSQVGQFIGWTGYLYKKFPWYEWLDREAGGQVGPLGGFIGVWTSDRKTQGLGYYNNPCTWVIDEQPLISTCLADAPGRNRKPEKRGLLLVRDRPHNYWW